LEFRIEFCGARGHCSLQPKNLGLFSWEESVTFDGAKGVRLQNEFTCLAQWLFSHQCDDWVWLLSGDNKSSFVIRMAVNVPGITWVEFVLASSVLCRFMDQYN